MVYGLLMGHGYYVGGGGMGLEVDRRGGYVGVSEVDEWFSGGWSLAKSFLGLPSWVCLPWIWVLLVVGLPSWVWFAVVGVLIVGLLLWAWNFSPWVFFFFFFNGCGFCL